MLPPETLPGALHDSKGRARLGVWLKRAETMGLILLLSCGWSAVGYLWGANSAAGQLARMREDHAAEISRLQAAYSTRLGNTADKVTEAANATAAAANSTAAAAQSVAESAAKQGKKAP